MLSTDPVDVAIDTATGALKLDAAGAPYMVSGAEAARQLIWATCQCPRGEWFANLADETELPLFENDYVPARETILGDGLFNRARVCAAYKRAIESLPIRMRVLQINAVKDARRIAAVTARVLVIFDDTTIEVDV